MAGTLANGGTCPITGERVFRSEAVGNVLSLMSSCGMSIYSGQFAFNVKIHSFSLTFHFLLTPWSLLLCAFQMGIPAISNVGGGMMLVIPDVAGISIYSPKLDWLNNPVRGVEFCQELINLYQFHKYDNVGMHGHSNKIDPTLKRSFTANELGIQLLFASANGDVVFLRR